MGEVKVAQRPANQLAGGAKFLQHGLVRQETSMKLVHLKLQIGATREFELLGTGEEGPSTAVLERLKASCALIDALGHKVALNLNILIYM